MPREARAAESGTHFPWYGRQPQVSVGAAQSPWSLPLPSPASPTTRSSTWAPVTSTSIGDGGLAAADRRRGDQRLAVGDHAEVTVPAPPVSSSTPTVGGEPGAVPAEVELDVADRVGAEALGVARAGDGDRRPSPAGLLADAGVALDRAPAVGGGQERQVADRVPSRPAGPVDPADDALVAPVAGGPFCGVRTVAVSAEAAGSVTGRWLDRPGEGRRSARLQALDGHGARRAHASSRRAAASEARQPGRGRPPVGTRTVAGP